MRAAAQGWQGASRALTHSRLGLSGCKFCQMDKRWPAA